MKCHCGESSFVFRHEGNMSRRIDQRLNQVTKWRKCKRGHVFPTLELTREEVQRLRALAFQGILAQAADARSALDVDAPVVFTKATKADRAPKPPVKKRAQDREGYERIRQLVTSGADATLQPREAAEKHQVDRCTIHVWRRKAREGAAAAA